MQRIVVIGASGSGKTTLGRWLGATLALPFTDLDDLHWRPGWVEAPPQEFRAAVDRVTLAERWVLAGNYAAVRDLTWPRADTLVWLDLPLATVLARASSRALRQWWSREPICNGNRQTLWHLVNGRDSLIGYTLRTYHPRRIEWPALIAAHSNLSAHRLQSPPAVRDWQRQLSATSPTDAVLRA